MDIHNYKGRMEKRLNLIKNSTIISEENKSVILEFQKEYLLKGSSVARVEKLLYHFYYVAQMLDKPFKSITKADCESIIEKIETSTNWGDKTKYDFKLSLKIFVKWLKGTEDYPEEVRWIKLNHSKNNHRLPEGLLTVEEIKRMVENSENTRDKALVLILYESGCRIGELLTLTIRNVAFDEYGVVLLVDGKTGQRRIRVISSTKALSDWLNMHPFKNNQDAFLWTGIGTRNRHQPITYHSVNTMLRRLAKRVNVNKKVNPHSFRHARATHLANNLTDAQMKQYFGWTQSSDMASIYVHLSGRDLDDTLLKLHGLKETRKEDTLKIQICERCDEKNSPAQKFCGRCGSPLDIRTALEMKDRLDSEDEQVLTALKKLANIPDVRKLLIEMGKGLQ